MKRLLVAVCLLSVVGVATTQAQNYIGIFADAEATTCYADFAIGVNVVTYYTVIFDPVEIDGCTGAEFRVENLPNVESPPVFITEDWGESLTIGDLATGLSIALDMPGPGPIVQLGTVSYFATADPGTVGPNHLMSVEETTMPEGHYVRIITDYGFNEIPVLGGKFTFNCTNPGDCGCLDTPTKSSSWSSIKTLY